MGMPLSEHYAAPALVGPAARLLDQFAILGMHTPKCSILGPCIDGNDILGIHTCSSWHPQEVEPGRCLATHIVDMSLPFEVVTQYHTQEFLLTHMFNLGATQFCCRY